MKSFQKNGISYVINLSMTCPKVVDDEHFLRIPVNDGYQDKLTPHFEDAWEFLGKQPSVRIQMFAAGVKTNSFFFGIIGLTRRGRRS